MQVMIKIDFVQFKVRERLQETKRSLFQNEIIFDVLQEILLEFHDKRNKKSVSADELQVRIYVRVN